MSVAKEYVAAYVLSALLFVAMTTRALLAMSWPINYDCAMYFRFGQLMLEGKLPYVDFVDFNPPLIMYIMTLPAGFANLFQLDPVATFNSFICLLAALSWGACLVLFLENKSHPEKIFFPTALVSVALMNFLANEWHEFGQRDHLLMMALIPYFFSRWFRWNGYRCNPILSAFIGIALAMGICMRPYCIVIPICLELFWLLRTRKYSRLIAPETLAAVITGVVYVLHFFVLPEAVRESIFHRWLPLVSRGYSCFDAELYRTAFLPMFQGVTPIIVVLAVSVFFLRCDLSLSLLVLASASYASYLIQHKGSASHLLSAMGACSLLGMIQVQLLANRLWKMDKQIKIAPYVVSTLCSILAVSLFFLPWVALIKIKHSNADLTAEKQLILRETGANDSVLVLSINLADSYPVLLETGRRTGGKYFFLFPTRMINYLREKSKSADEIAKLNAEDTRVLDEIAQDVQVYKPKLILVSATNLDFPGYLSIFQFLTDKNFFDTALKNYTKIGECQAFSKLIVYKLNSPSTDSTKSESTSTSRSKTRSTNSTGNENAAPARRSVIEQALQTEH